MVKAPQSFSLGVEEEYLLVDLETLDLVEASGLMVEECQSELAEQVSPEFLQCQIEVGTRVCANVTEAREELTRLRSCIKRVANSHGMAPLAVSCHPFADWRNQHHTDKERYNSLERDLAGIARRMLICGQHVHVGINGDELRIDLMKQFSYFLPHLLALTTSSPFWEGQDTGLASYRLAVFDNLPRTGLPPSFGSFSEYSRSVQTIVNTGLIQDGSKIWWDLRPSSKFPTLEARICDVSPRLSTTLAVTALTQCLMRMLYRLRKHNQRWRVYDRFLIGENRWRAQRYGITEGLIDFGLGEVVPFADLLEEMIGLVAEDAEELGCVAELHSLRDIAQNGTSSERQRQIYNQVSRETGSSDQGFRAVVTSLIEEFSQDL